MRQFILIPLIFLTGCATIVKGSTQDVYINSTPSKAKCEFTREGRRRISPERMY